VFSDWLSRVKRLQNHKADGREIALVANFVVCSRRTLNQFIEKLQSAKNDGVVFTALSLLY